MEGYRLQVTASDTEPVKMDHGRVVVDKGIKVEILTADGMPYTCGELTFTVDAASPMTESENPKIYHHVDGALAEWDSWQNVKLSEDKKTLTTGNQITAPAEFLIDHWEPADGDLSGLAGGFLLHRLYPQKVQCICAE